MVSSPKIIAVAAAQQLQCSGLKETAGAEFKRIGNRSTEPLGFANSLDRRS